MLKVERSIKTSFTEESNQLFFNYKGYQYNLFPGDFLIFEYNEFIDGFHFICVERGKDSLKKYKKCNSMNPIPKTKIIRLKGQKLAKLNERIHQRDQHKCIYCGDRVDPGEKFHHEHNGIKSDQIEYGVLLCMDYHTERHHGKKCNDVKEYCRKYLINLYGESIYSK